MNGKFRAVWVAITIASLVTFVLGGGVIYATPSLPHLSSHGSIIGPIDLTLTLKPAVARPRDPVSLEVVLTNHQASPVSPELLLRLPPSLLPRGDRLPAGTSYNFQSNTLSWMPLLGGGDGTARLQLDFTASVADLLQPAQAVEAVLRHSGLERSTAVDFWVGLPPSVSVGASPAVVAVDTPVQLSALTSGSGPFVQNWDIGDGRQLTAQDPQVAFGSPGSYRVTVRVANPLASASASMAITVVATPTAAFTVEDELPVVAQAVQFFNESGGQQPHSYSWDFGDGSTSTEASPAHAYRAPGIYTVRLRVDSEHGSAETSRTVQVGVGPVLDFIIDSSARTGQTIYGQAFTDDTVTALHWDMGDGRQYEAETVEHAYYRTGDYLVTVRGSNEFGSSEVSHWVLVEAGDFFTYLPILASEAISDVTALAVPLPGEVILGQDAPGGDEPPPVETAPAAAMPSLPAIAQPGGAAAGEPPAPLPTLPSGQEVVAPSNPEPVQPVVLPEQSPLPPEATPAEQLLWYINEARRLHNLPPLSYSYELTIAAQMHTEDMVATPGIMHQGSDGSNPIQRQQRYGYQGYYGGEAVAWGWESAVPVVEFWVNSPPHRILILDPNIREVGVGYFADGLAPNIWYWTAEFGYLPGTDPALVTPGSR